MGNRRVNDSLLRSRLILAFSGACHATRTQARDGPKYSSRDANRRRERVFCLTIVYVYYHAVREAVAMGECLIGHVSTHENPADIATKVLPGGQKRDHLIGLVLYDIVDDW